MTDETTITPPKAKRRKKAKRAAPKTVRELPPAAGELDGLSATDCPFECGPDCVITGDICGHPNKGGLQSVHQSKPDVIRRFNQARKILAHAKVEKRG